MSILRSLTKLLRSLLYEWVRALLTILRTVKSLIHEHEDRDDLGTASPCVPVDHPAFVRPDPLIYSQRYLAAQGLAITWNNPDIELFENGLPVPSHSLKKNTEYQVRARIWNNSFEAPVFNMKVQLSMLGFGVGTDPVAIGDATTNVGVKGGPGHPAFVSIPWRTPDLEGHVCLQVMLDPFDDTNSENNLGQENTNVGVSASPVDFDFLLANEDRRPHQYWFEPDVYELSALEPCADDTETEQDRRRKRIERQRRGNHPVPPDWTVEITPARPTLAPGDEIPIAVTITPPDGFVGSQPFNINAVHERGVAGGVTLIVEGNG